MFKFVRQHKEVVETKNSNYILLFDGPSGLAAFHAEGKVHHLIQAGNAMIDLDESHLTELDKSLRRLELVCSRSEPRLV